MRTITALPGITSIPTLQEHAQLNTIEELILQREKAREIQKQLVLAVAALHAYFERGSPIDKQPYPLPPWEFPSITTNNPTKVNMPEPYEYTVPVVQNKCQSREVSVKALLKYSVMAE